MINLLPLAHRGCALALGLLPPAMSPCVSWAGGLIGGSVPSRPLSSLPTRPRVTAPGPSQPLSSAALVHAALGASPCVSLGVSDVTHPKWSSCLQTPTTYFSQASAGSSSILLEAQVSSPGLPLTSLSHSQALGCILCGPDGITACPTASPWGGPSVARQVSLLSPFPAVHLPDPFLPQERSPGAPSCFLTSGAPHVPVCPIAFTWLLPIVGSAVTHTVCDVCLLHAAAGGTGACWLAPQVVMPRKGQNEQDGVSSNI